MDKTLCNYCTKRELCTGLCPEAEAYANQDAGEYHKPGEVHFTPTEKRILSLLASGRTRKQIGYYLKLSAHALEEHISNLRKKAQYIVL
jgi:DNA-binding NarL/FixJ family response regulator